MLNSIALAIVGAFVGGVVTYLFRGKTHKSPCAAVERVDDAVHTLDSRLCEHSETLKDHSKRIADIEGTIKQQEERDKWFKEKFVEIMSRFDRLEKKING